MSHSKDLLEKKDRIEALVKTIVKSDLKWYEKVYQIAIEVAKIVEEVNDGAKDYLKLTGPEKKDIAMALIEEIWFEKADIKWVPNFIERPLVRKLANTAIDKAVEYLHKTGVFKRVTAELYR